MEYDTGALALGLIINLICTAAYYMAPVLIYRFFIYKSRLPKSMARKICILSGVVMYLILFVIYVATGFEGSPNMKAAFLYTWILYLIVRDSQEGVSPKIDLRQQMIDYGRQYSEQYLAGNPDIDEEERIRVDNLFSQIIPYAHTVPVDQIRKEMKRQKQTPEMAALNIIQNAAMFQAKNNIDATDALFGINEEAQTAINVYRFLNDIKLEKKFISRMQYDENERLITAIRYNAPYV